MESDKQVQEAVCHIKQLLLAQAAKNNLGRKEEAGRTWLDRFNIWFPQTTTSSTSSKEEAARTVVEPAPPREMLEMARTR